MMPKTRQKRKPKSDEEKLLNKVRKLMPMHTVQVEILVSDQQHWRLTRVGEHLRVIRNTVLGHLLTNYRQMVRTKAHKRLSEDYRSLCEIIEKITDVKILKELTEKKKEFKEGFEQLRNRYNVTFEYARKKGETLRKEKFTLPDAVTVLSVCEMVWNSIEGLLYRKASKVHFYKKNELVTFQGKQSNRCIILKNKHDGYVASFDSMSFPLFFKDNDLYIQETLDNIAHYISNGVKLDSENCTRHNAGLSPIPTYRVCNNRIVRKEIRGKTRYYLQIVLEGNPVPRRKKDGSFRHSYGVGRISGDIGTQSLGVVGDTIAILKNFAERSTNTFAYERNIYLLQRYLDRSRRAANPQNYDESGCNKKGKMAWHLTNRYKGAALKIRELHCKAAESRKYAHNQDINYLRTLGDEFIIEIMNIKGLQKKSKEATINTKTGKFNRRKRFGKSIGKRSPGYFIQQAKYRFDSTGGVVKEVNTWTFKASQYDHVLDDATKKKLSMRWHVLPDGTRIQRDLYSAFLLYCSDQDLTKPDKELCDETFKQFLKLHDLCIDDILQNRRVIMNSGIKLTKSKLSA